MTLIYGFCKSEIMNNVEYKIKIAIKVLKWEKRSENILEVYCSIHNTYLLLSINIKYAFLNSVNFLLVKYAVN